MQDDGTGDKIESSWSCLDSRIDIYDVYDVLSLLLDDLLVVWSNGVNH